MMCYKMRTSSRATNTPSVTRRLGGPSRPEARAVLGRVDEGLDHLGGDEVSAELVELREPEVVAVEVRVRRGVRVAPEIAEVLHQDECSVELVAVERLILRDLAQD